MQPTGKIYAQTTILDRETNVEVPLTITKVKTMGRDRTLYAYIGHDQTFAGHMHYEKIAPGRCSGSHGTAAKAEEYGVGTNLEKQVPYVYVDLRYMTSHKLADQIEQKLLESLHKISSKSKSGCEGRLKVKIDCSRQAIACRKMGLQTQSTDFSVSPKGMDAQIDTMIAMQSITGEIFRTVMFLPRNT